MVDCIVVGGGLIGMLSARELTKSGLDVLLLEKGELGKESSWAGGGILSPLHPWRYSDEVNRLANIGHNSYEKLAQELHEESGIDPEYIRCGLMVVGSNETEDALAWSEKWSINLSVIDGSSQVQQLLPGINAKFDQGLWMPDIAQMRNPRLVKAARGSLDALGIKYKEHVQVGQLNITNNRVTGVTANGKAYHADRVLIAGGAWSAEILKDLQAPKIEPVKGQMILFKGQPGFLKSMVLSESRYLIPRKDGRILCGSTIEHMGFEKSISEEVKQELVDSAFDIFPPLKELTLEHHWAGLRPGSPTGDPFIGQHNGIHGLYINAGHFRNGVILGIGSCRQVASDIVSGA